jgi:hypothetical protein
VSEEGALNPNDRLNENNLDPNDPQTNPTLDADGEPKVDADNALNDPSVDADKAVDDPSAEADNVRETEPAAERQDVNPYVAEETGADNDLRQDGTELGQDDQQADPQQVDPQQVDPQEVDAQQVNGQQVDPQQVDAQQDPSLDGNNAQQTDVDQSAEQSSPGATNQGVVEWDTDRDGSHIELDAENADGTVYQTGENGPSLTVNGGEQGQQQSTPDVEGQEQGGSQSAEAVNIDRVDGQTFTVGQGGVQFAEQNEASAGTEGPSTSQAEGTQWRPPEQAAEDPAIAEARATQGNKQQRGPGKELPPDEKAQFDNTRGDQEPLSKVKVDSAGVATNDRPGTPAAQRGQDRNRGQGNEGRGNDGGRER